MVSIHTAAAVYSTTVLMEGVPTVQHAHTGVDFIVREKVISGRGADIGMETKICVSNEIQKCALIYELAKSEARVFIGPGVMPTNYENPCAINPNDSQKDGGIGDWLEL